MSDPDFIAGYVATDVHTPSNLFAGELPITTKPERVLSGQNLAQYAPVGRVAATGKLKIWNPALSDGTEKLVGIMTNACDATAGDAWGEIYWGGFFNIDAIAWPGGTTTLQKVQAFDGHPTLAARGMPDSITNV